MTKLVTMTTNKRYQCECSECHCDIWFYCEQEINCPNCGKKLREVSSEDADEGKFQEIETRGGVINENHHH